MYTLHVVSDVADELSECNFTMSVALNEWNNIPLFLVVLISVVHDSLGVAASLNPRQCPTLL